MQKDHLSAEGRGGWVGAGGGLGGGGGEGSSQKVYISWQPCPNSSRDDDSKDSMGCTQYGVSERIAIKQLDPAYLNMVTRCKTICHQHAINGS